MSDWGSLWGMDTEDSKVFLAAVGGTLAVLVFQRLVDWAASGLQSAWRVLRRSQWGHKSLRWQLFQNGFGNVWIYLYNPSSVTFEFCHVIGNFPGYMLSGVHGIRKLSPGERVLVLEGRPNFEGDVTSNSFSFRSFRPKKSSGCILMGLIRKYGWGSKSFDGQLILGSSVPFKNYFIGMMLRCSGGNIVWESHLSSLGVVGLGVEPEEFKSKSGETVRLIKPKPESDV